LTGYLHSDRIVPTGSLEFILPLLDFVSLAALVTALLAPEPIGRLALA
jgi:hypothetical protein